MLIRAGASKEDSWLHRDAHGRMGEQAPKVLASLGEQAPEVLTSLGEQALHCSLIPIPEPICPFAQAYPRIWHSAASSPALLKRELFDPIRQAVTAAAPPARVLYENPPCLQVLNIAQGGIIRTFGQFGIF